MKLIDGDRLAKDLKGLLALATIVSGMRTDSEYAKLVENIIGIVEKSQEVEPPVRKGKWIPVSDPPDTDRTVFIARGERDCMSVCIGHYSNEYKQWYEDRNWFGMLLYGGLYFLYDGLYWCEMPQLPEPYREEGDS